jgi:hypothetical protein
MIKPAVALDFKVAADWSLASVLKLIGLLNTFPAATAELSLAMNFSRLGGHVQGMRTGVPLGFMPSQLPPEGLVLGRTPKEGSKESIVLWLACRGWRGEPVVRRARENMVKGVVNCISMDGSEGRRRGG